MLRVQIRTSREKTVPHLGVQNAEVGPPNGIAPLISRTESNRNQEEEKREEGEGQVTCTTFAATAQAWHLSLSLCLSLSLSLSLPLSLSRAHTLIRACSVRTRVPGGPNMNIHASGFVCSRHLIHTKLGVVDSRCQGISLERCQK